LLYVADDGIINNLLWTVFFLTDINESYAELIMESINPRRLIQLISSYNDTFRLLAIKIIGNICCFSDSGTKDFIENNSIQSLRGVITEDNDPLIISEACWTLSNMVGDVDNISSILDLVDPLIYLVKNAKEYRAKREAVWVLVNACLSAESEEFLLMVKKGVFSAFVLMLNEKGLDIQTLKAVKRGLELGLENEIAKEWELVGGVEKLNALQLTKNEEVYKLVVEILEQLNHMDESISHNN